MKILIKKFSIEKRTLLRLVFFLLADAVLLTLSVLLAFLVRFEGQIPVQYSINILGIVILLLLITIPIFYFSKLYYFTWIYVSTTELISLARATVLSFLILAASFFVLREHQIFSGFPRSTLFITYFFAFLLCGGIRFAKRIYLQIFAGKNKKGKETTLIAGAGDAGEQILRSISGLAISPYLPLGFVDDNPAKEGISIHGVRVLGKIRDIPAIVKEKRIETLIVALPSAGSETIRAAVEAGRRAGLKKIKIVPSLDEIIDGRVGIGNLKEVDMKDLLGRDEVILDEKEIENFIRGKNILITGAAGSIGSELCRQAARFSPAKLMLLDQDETGIFNIAGEMKSNFPELAVLPLVADIQDRKKMEMVFNKFRPQVVFHAAAYKHVPLMEEQPEEAVKNNILGTKTIAATAAQYSVEKFIFISTDKAVNPTSVMGASKRTGEMICQSLEGATKFISVRFGNVADSRGSVIPIFKEKIKKREQIEITHADMERYFMTIPEACLLVLRAGAMGQGGEVFVLDMGNPVKIFDLARDLVRLSGLRPDVDIPIVFTAPRPGEKFFEEILTAEEGTVATQEQKIFRAKLSKVDKTELNSKIAKLRDLAATASKSAIIETLKEIVPTYKNAD